MKNILFILLVVPQLLFSMDNPNYTEINLKHCREIAWMSDGTILANCQSTQNPSKSARSIFSIDTNNSYQQKALCTFEHNENDSNDYFITLNQEKTVAFIPLPNTSLIYENGNIKEVPSISTEWRPVILSGNNIIFINENNLLVYDGKTIKPDTTLNTLLEKIKEISGFRLPRELLKSSINNHQYVLASEANVFRCDQETENVERIPLPDIAIAPIDMPISPFDIQIHSNGIHVALTYDVPYNCWILNLSTKELLLLKKKKENSEVERLRKQYEENPTHDNGRLLIIAAWDAQFKIDSKDCHPSLPLIATLTKYKGLVKYWNIKTGEKIIKQRLPYQSETPPVSCMNRLITFSPNGTQIVCGLNEALVILNVPAQEMCKKVDEKL